MSLFGFSFRDTRLSTLVSVCFALALVYKVASTLIVKKLRAVLTAVDDLPKLGLPRPGGKIRGTAVICGGSIAGLFSARVCADHFEKVIIVEPEAWLATAEGQVDRHRERTEENLPVQKRLRVLQYTSLHVYQSFANLALRKWFSEYDIEVLKTGGRFGSSDWNLHMSGTPIVAPTHQYRGGVLPNSILQARPAFETTIRRLVMTTCKNVHQITGTVIGLVRQDSGRIDEVRVRTPDGEESTLPATLVIDCTGAALGGLHWLQDLSSQNKELEMSAQLETLKTTYNPKMIYNQFVFDVPTHLIEKLRAVGFPHDFNAVSWAYVNFPDSWQDNRQFIIGRKENNIFEVGCGCWGLVEELQSIADLKVWISKIISNQPIPDWIYSTLDLLEAEEVPFTCKLTRCPPSVYVRYNRAQGLPSNFIALGDSVLQINPVRGQGCTKACVEAVSLNALLSKCVPLANGTHCSLPADFGQKFFAVQAHRTGPLWTLYKSEDYGWKTTIPAKGDDLASTCAWNRAFVTNINQLVRTDREVAAVWLHVMHWVAPPTDLFSPFILRKMVWMKMKQLFTM
ncbi:hypothetical protein K439DRAFT_1639514 [Ramaria rubella]|nr:hypothetical protein K439DRAFT_1639514 [Ramaria rubella]